MAKYHYAEVFCGLLWVHYMWLFVVGVVGKNQLFAMVWDYYVVYMRYSISCSSVHLIWFEIFFLFLDNNSIWVFLLEKYDIAPHFDCMWKRAATYYPSRKFPFCTSVKGDKEKALVSLSM